MKAAIILALSVFLTSAVRAEELKVDKKWDLNFDHKVINKKNYSGGATIDLPKNNKKVDVHIGVDINAASIQCELTKVKGQVIFKGNLEGINNSVTGKVRNLIDKDTNTTPQVPTQPQTEPAPSQPIAPQAEPQQQGSNSQSQTKEEQKPQ